jgi:hypothetical protein
MACAPCSLQSTKKLVMAILLLTVTTLFALTTRAEMISLVCEGELVQGAAGSARENLSHYPVSFSLQIDTSTKAIFDNLFPRWVQAQTFENGKILHMEINDKRSWMISIERYTGEARGTLVYNAFGKPAVTENRSAASQVTGYSKLPRICWFNATALTERAVSGEPCSKNSLDGMVDSPQTGSSPVSPYTHSKRPGMALAPPPGGGLYSVDGRFKSTYQAVMSA